MLPLSSSPTAPTVFAHPAPPPFEVADIVRAYGAVFRATHTVSHEQTRVLRAIAQCRTAALGGHVEQCVSCGTERVCYDSCRNRHCPKCQGSARAKWLAAEQALLLPIPYFHLVFTLPHQLNPLIRVNQRLLYDLLFQTAAQTLQEFARDPKHLGAEIGVTAVLHTWGQTLTEHIHVHCVVTGGGLSPDGTQWHAGHRRFLFPVKAQGTVFRGKYLAGLERLRSQQRLTFAGESAPLAEDVAVACVAAAALRQTVGRLRQTAVGQSGASAEVSQPLHPSRGHRQFAFGLCRRWRRALSLHRLRSGRNRQSDGTPCGGVSAPLPTSRPADRLRADSPLWLARQSRSAGQAHPRPSALGDRGRDSASVSHVSASHGLGSLTDRRRSLSPLR